MTKKLLIDLGSSSVKAYSYDGLDLKLHKVISLHFKQNYTPDNPRDNESYKELVKFINTLKSDYKNPLVRIYATAFFRKLDKSQRQLFINCIYEDTGEFVNVISHDLENFYMQQALIGKFPTDKKALLINIGGGSTELSVIENGKSIEEHNLAVGVGDLLGNFDGINNEYSEYSIKEVIKYINQKLPDLNNTVDTAFYSGGELNYMVLADYPLIDNDIFKDTDHPYVIKTSEFAKKNIEIYESIRLQDLEKLMPENPKWMHGARVCSALAQAICEKYDIGTLIPSDSNLINGVVRKELRTVTISGSFRKHLSEIVEAKDMLEKSGTKVLSPRFTKPKNPGEEFVVFTGEEGMTPLELEQHHLDSILKSDALIVVCPKGYVGASALIEIGYANNSEKRIIFTEKPEEFMLNTLPREVGV